MDYTADVTVEEVWERLKSEEKAILVDVRTEAEWAFVGICDLSQMGKQPLLVSWQNYPHMAINEGFAQMILAQNITADAPLYFICRSGVRSASAAALMIKEGFEECYNISGGFEGDCDENGHRGTCGGWKAAGLPWRQN